jgi:peptidoglycan hydrolase-like protein with peptidoglycan-binding domain
MCAPGVAKEHPYFMTLQKGERSDAVRTLQGQLAVHGYPLIMDGWFGPATEQAVIAFQQANGLLPLGQVGPRTRLALEQQPEPKYLNLTDYERASHLTGLPIAVIATVAQVEGLELGFAETGKPVVLFERHWFYRRLKVHGLCDDELDALVQAQPDLIDPKRGGYIGGAAEWTRFQRAADINLTAAIEATRWGLFQLMGLQWGRMGFVDGLDFQMAMQHSEGAHLNAFCKFILTDRILTRALQEQNWAVFARRYNGPGFRDNLYDVKLARVYARLRGRYA